VLNPSCRSNVYVRKRDAWGRGVGYFIYIRVADSFRQRGTLARRAFRGTQNRRLLRGQSRRFTVGVQADQAFTSGDSADLACVRPFSHPVLREAKLILKAVGLVFWTVDESVPVLLPKLTYSFSISHEHPLTI